MQKKDRNSRDFQLIEEICCGNEKAFEQLFFENYVQLCRFAVKITRSGELARDCVQDVFFKIWRNRETWDIQSSLKAYLYQAVRNQALNLVEQQMNYHKLAKRLQHEMSMYKESDNNSYLNKPGERSEAVEQIWQVVNKMPEQRKQVFELHRKHGLTHQEISDVMQIARKTVENHMARALQELREKLDVRHLLEEG